MSLDQELPTSGFPSSWQSHKKYIFRGDPEHRINTWANTHNYLHTTSVLVLVKQSFSCHIKWDPLWEFQFHFYSSPFYFFALRKCRSPTTTLISQPPNGSWLQVEALCFVRPWGLQSGYVSLPHQLWEAQFSSAGRSNETCILKRSPCLLCGSWLEGASTEAGRPERKEAATIAKQEMVAAWRWQFRKANEVIGMKNFVPI